MSGSSFLIDYSITPSSTEGGKPNVVISIQPVIPVPHQSTANLFESILAKLSTSTSGATSSNLDSLLTSLQASTTGLSDSTCEIQSDNYNDYITEIKNKLSTGNANEIPSTTRQSEISQLLQGLFKSFSTAMTTDQMATSSEMPTKTTQRPLNQTITTKNGTQKSLTTLTSQMKLTSSNNATIANTINSISASLSNKKTTTNPTSTVPTFSPSSSDTVSSVSSLQSAISQLQSKVAVDPKVSSYVSGMLTQFQDQISQGEYPSDGGSKLKGSMGLLKFGIPPNSNNETKSALINLETIIDRIFPSGVQLTMPQTATTVTKRSGRFTRRTSIQTDSATTSNLKTMISNLQTQQASVSVSYQTKLTNGTATQTDTSSYIDTLSSLGNQISSLQKQLKNSSSSRTQTETPIQKFVTGLGEQLGKTQLGTFSRRIVGLAPQFAGTSRLGQSQVSAISTQMNSVIAADTVIQTPTTVTSLTSSLQVGTTLSSSGSDLDVKCTGTLNGVSYGVSYSLKIESLSYISTEAYNNVTNISESGKQKICSDYGITPKSLTVTNQEIWNAYLVFLFTYLSLSVYCIVDPSNSLGIQLPETDYKNLMFLLRPDILESFSNISIPVSSLKMSDDSKQITGLSTARNWTFYMYKRTNPETSTNSAIGQSIVSALSSITGSLNM